jgi:hypothetical protein
MTNKSDQQSKQSTPTSSADTAQDRWWDTSIKRFSKASTVAPAVQIYGPKGYHEKVDEALLKIIKAPSGKKLIDGFAGPAGKKNFVTITDAGPRDATFPRLNEKQAEHVKKNLGAETEDRVAARLAQKRSFGRKGQGANAEIVWRPNESLDLNQDGRPIGMIGTPDEAHLALAHELVHARRIVKGTYTGAMGDRHDPTTPAGKEELRAVGIGSLRNRTRVSENSVRKDLKFPLRTSYNKVGQTPPSTPRKKPGGLSLS